MKIYSFYTAKYTFFRFADSINRIKKCLSVLPCDVMSSVTLTFVRFPAIKFS